jgi:hypothetical protein
MGGACCTYDGKNKRMWNFWWGNLKGRGNLDNLGVDGRIILNES